jgi:uncharacterized protein
MPRTITPTGRTVGLSLAVLLVAGGLYEAGSLVGAAGRSPAYAAPQSGQAADISVTGLGRASGTPDVLTVQLSTTATRGNVSDALSGAGSALRRVRKVLTGNHVAAADIQTSDLTVQPNYQYENGRQVVQGYAASESLTVKLRNLPRAGTVITRATDAGGNAVSIEDVSFSLQDNESVLASARSAAFANAKAKAKQYATAAGRTLGPAVRISETVDDPTEPAPTGEKANSAVSVDPGTEDLSVTVHVVFDLR